MAEITVKLLADAHELLNDADAAVALVEAKRPVIAFQADTSNALDAAKKLKDDIEKMRPVIQIAGNPAGAPPPSAAGALRGGGQGPGGLPGSGSQHDPNKPIMDFLKQQQTQNQKMADAITKALEDVTRASEKSANRSGSSGGNSRNSDSQNGSNPFLNWAGMNQTGKDGKMTLNDIMGRGGGGLGGILGAIPGGNILTSFLSLGGLMSVIGTSVKADAAYNEQSRGDAAQDLLDSYQVYGSVRAFDSRELAANGAPRGDLSYYQGANDAMRIGESYAYSMSDMMNIADTLISESGFSDTQSHRQAMTNIAESSRALGVDTNAAAHLTATAIKSGMQESGDNSILNLAAYMAQAGSMEGREDEIISILQDQLDEQRALTGEVSASAMFDRANVLTTIGNIDSSMKGERGQQALDSVSDWATSGDMTTMILAGWGTKFTGTEGWLKMTEMREENPMEFTRMVLEGATEAGYSDSMILQVLSEQGIGTVKGNRAALQAFRQTGDVSGFAVEDNAQTIGEGVISDAMQDFDASGTHAYGASVYFDANEASWNGAQDLPNYATNYHDRLEMGTEQRIAHGKTMSNPVSKFFAGFTEYDSTTKGYSTNALQNLDYEYMGENFQGVNYDEMTGGGGFQSLSGSAQQTLESIGRGEKPETFGWQAFLGFAMNPGMSIGLTRDAFTRTGIFDQSNNTGGSASSTTQNVPYLSDGIPESAGYAPKTLPSDTYETAMHLSSLRVARPAPKPITDYAAADYISVEYPLDTSAGAEGQTQAYTLRGEDSAAFTQMAIKSAVDAGYSGDAIIDMLSAQGTVTGSENRDPMQAIVGPGSDAESSSPLLSFFNPGLTGLRPMFGMDSPSAAEQDNAFTSPLSPVADWFTSIFSPNGVMETETGSGSADNSALASYGYMDDSAEVQGGVAWNGISDHDASASYALNGNNRIAPLEYNTPEQQITDALVRNTEELRRNTQALMRHDTSRSGIMQDVFDIGHTFSSATYQPQAGLNVNAQRDGNDTSVSIQSAMSRVQNVAKRILGVGTSSGTASSAITGIAGIASNVASMLDTGTDTETDTDTATPHATGNEYVPFDNYPALLHKGEMVLRRDEAELVRQGRLDTQENMDSLSAGIDLQKPSPIDELDPSGSAILGVSPIDRILSTPSEPQSGTLSFEGGSINLNINVTGQVQGMDTGMQKQMVDSIQAQIAGAGLRDMVANGFTRRQNW